MKVIIIGSKAYSALNHRRYYTLGEIKRGLQERSVNRHKE